MSTGRVVGGVLDTQEVVFKGPETCKASQEAPWWRRLRSTAVESTKREETRPLVVGVLEEAAVI